jgi:hypothetical protein
MDELIHFDEGSRVSKMKLSKDWQDVSAHVVTLSGREAWGFQPWRT